MNKNTKLPILLLNSDPLAGGGASDDPMAMPAGDVDTRFPRLKEGVYRMVIRKPERKDNAEKQNKALVMQLETTTVAEDTDGQPLPIGFKFTHRINGVKGERTKEALTKDLALLAKAVFGAAGAKAVNILDLWNSPETIIADKTVDVKVGIKAASGDFPEANSVRTFIIPN